MPESPLIKKLRLQPGQRIALLNAPPGYIEGLGELPPGVVLVAEPEEGACDWVQLFAASSAELLRLFPIAQRACKYDGLLWVSYPKLSGKLKGDLNRDIVWELLQPTGLRSVTQVALDDAWSALRFRPAAKVKP